MFDLHVPEDWRLVKLSDLGEVNRGRSRHRPRDAAHLYGGPYPFVQTGDVKASQGRVTNYTQTYSKDGLAQSRLWPKGTMCITIAANIAETGILQFPACFPDSIIGFIADKTKCNVFFIEYVFRLLRRRIQAQATGSVQDNINLQTLERLLFPIPELEEQNTIANILCSFDDKIELNRQTNQTLEHIAQAIFKSWFVDFEPTRAKIAAKQIAQARQESERSAALRAALFADDRWPEAVATAIAEGDPERAAMAAISGKSLDEIDQLSPGHDVHGSTNVAGAGCAGATLEQLITTAALFPDALVDCELGEIPQGWEVKEIKELSSKISKGTTPRKADIQKAEDAETIPFLKVRDISNDGEITRIGLDKIPESIHSGVLKRSMLEANDILFSIAGTIGRVALVEEDLSISNCNQAVAFVRLKDSEKYLELCRLNLVGSRVQNEVASKVVQGVQANFSLTGLGEIKVLIPSEDFLSVFNRAIGDIGNKQRLLLNENRKLATLRDALLPKLLSGELKASPNQTELDKTA